MFLIKISPLPSPPNSRTKGRGNDFNYGGLEERKKKRHQYDHLIPNWIAQGFCKLEIVSVVEDQLM